LIFGNLQKKEVGSELINFFTINISLLTNCLTVD
jgi:hypothetical protein